MHLLTPTCDTCFWYQNPLVTWIERHVTVAPDIKPFVGVVTPGFVPAIWITTGVSCCCDVIILEEEVVVVWMRIGRLQNDYLHHKLYHVKHWGHDGLSNFFVCSIFKHKFLNRKCGGFNQQNFGEASYCPYPAYIISILVQITNDADGPRSHYLNQWWPISRRMFQGSFFLYAPIQWDEDIF